MAQQPPEILIETFGMKGDSLAEYEAEVEFWEVCVHTYWPCGEIDVAEEITVKQADQIDAAIAELQARYPQAKVGERIPEE